MKIATEDKRQPKKKSSEASYSKVLRFAELIDYPRDVLKGYLAVESAKAKDFYRSFSICKELFERVPDTSTATILSSVIFIVSQYLSNSDACIGSPNLARTHAMLPSVVKELAMQCLLLCDESSLFDMVQLFKSGELLANLLEASDLGEYRDSVKK